MCVRKSIRILHIKTENSRIDELKKKSHAYHVQLHRSYIHKHHEMHIKHISWKNEASINGRWKIVRYPNYVFRG